MDTEPPPAIRLREDYSVTLGGEKLFGVPTLLTYKDKKIISLSRRENDGQLGVYAKLHNHKGQHIATVHRNKIPFTVRDKYRAILELDRYAIEDLSTGELICDIRQRGKSPASELTITLITYLPGFVVRALPDRIMVNNSTLKGNRVQDVTVAIAIGGNPKRAWIYFGDEISGPLVIGREG